MGEAAQWKDREMMKKLVGLVMLFASLGALAVSASTAGAEVTPNGNTTQEVTLPDGTTAEEVTLPDGTVAVVTPMSASEMSPMSLAQCSFATVCAWETPNYDGNFSWWSSTDTGCHSHDNNPVLHSGYNRTGWIVYYGSLEVQPEHGFFFPYGGGNPITGMVCFASG